MIRKIVFAWCCLVLGFVGAARAAQAETFERGYEAARAELAAGLVELADWSKGRKLFASHAELCEEVLRLEPDNEAAREGLGYKKQRDGSWKEPKSRKAGKDHDQGAKEELDVRLGALRDAYTARCLDLLEEHAADVAGERKARLMAELVAATPDNARLRKVTHEAREGEAWVLEETITAKARREELRALVQRLYAESSEPPTTTANEREQAFGIEWTTVVDVQVARVLGTGRREEVVTFGRVLPVALKYFQGVIGVEAEYYPDAAVFLLANPGEKERFLKAHPKVDEKYLKFLVTLEGSGITKSSDLAYWASDERLRVDGSTRIVLSWLFRDAFQVTPEHGWIFEGFGLYMTRELIGTRLTWFAQPSELTTVEEDQALRARLLDPKTNWMDEALKVLSSDRSPSLAFVVGKDINGMTPEDLLLAYVTAAYLLEGRPEQVAPLLKLIGSGTLSTLAIEQVFGMDVRAFDARVRRWLSERK